MEHPVKMDDLGGPPIFLETPISGNPPFFWKISHGFFHSPPGAPMAAPQGEKKWLAATPDIEENQYVEYSIQ